MKKLFDEATGLSDEDRAELADLLLASLPTEFDPEVEQAWHDEIRRRGEDIDSGRVKTVPWDAVRAEMNKLLREKTR